VSERERERARSPCQQVYRHTAPDMANMHTDIPALSGLTGDNHSKVRHGAEALTCLFVNRALSSNPRFGTVFQLTFLSRFPPIYMHDT